MCDPYLTHPFPKVKKEHPPRSPTMAFSALNCPAVSQLLTQVQSDFGIQESLSAKYFGVLSDSIPLALPTPVVEKKKRQIKDKPVDQLCQAVTTKGQCKFVSKCDGLCGIHLRKKNKDADAGPAVPKVVKKPKAPKKPEAPKHSHPLSEEADNCPVCETQGNVIAPELTKAEFEAVAEDGKSIQARLKAILANSDNDESDDEPEEVAKPVEVVKPVEVPEPVEVAEMEEDEEGDYDEEEEMTISLRAKLAKLVAEEDDDDEEDVDISQMCDTPPSRDKLASLMGKLNVKDNAFDFEALELDMES